MSSGLIEVDFGAGLSRTPIVWHKYNPGDYNSSAASMVNYGTQTAATTFYNIPIDTSQPLFGGGCLFLLRNASNIQSSTSATLANPRQFSVSFWVNPINLATNGTGGWIFYINLPGVEINIESDSTRGIRYNSTNYGVMNDNQWNSIIVVGNGTTITIYVNGVGTIGTYTQPNTTSPTLCSFRPLSRSSTSKPPCNIYFDNLRIFNGVLTAADITKLASENIPVVGSGTPTINSVTPGLLKLTVAFTPNNTGWNPLPTYYYSTNGVNFSTVTAVTSPFDIPNVTQATTVWIVAQNTAGNLFSAPFGPVTPLIIAVPSAPTINTVNTISTTSRTIRVSLTDTVNLANNGTINYWYSINGAAYINSNVIFSGSGTYFFDISGLSTPDISYTIGVIAQNASGGSTPVFTSALPVFGDQPIITSVSPVSGLANTLRISYNHDFKGTAPVTYFYTTDNSANTTNRTQFTTNPVDISNVSVTRTYYVIARNGAGNLISLSGTGTPYTTPLSPNSISATFNLPVITVTVTDTSNSTANEIRYWYYAYKTTDVSNTSNDIASYTQGPVFTSSPTTFDISGLVVGSTYFIYVVARNSVGNSSPLVVYETNPTVILSDRYDNYKTVPYVLNDRNPGTLKDAYRIAASTGITFPSLTSDISNVKFVVSNGNAAVVRLVTGNAVVVGTGFHGGNPSQTVRNALNNSTNVIKVVCNDTAFCAIYVPAGQTRRRVIHWGFYGLSDIETIGTTNPNFRNISTVEASLNLVDISDIAINAEDAFLALNTSGQIYTWGDIASGGNILDANRVNGSTTISTWLSGKTFNRISAGRFHFGAIATNRDGIIWGARDPSSAIPNGSFHTATVVEDFYFTNTRNILCSGFITHLGPSTNTVFAVYNTTSNIGNITLISGLATTTPIFTLQRMNGGRATATAIPATSEVWVYLDNARRLRMFAVSNAGVPTLVNDVSSSNANFFSATPSVLTYKEGSTLKSYATTADADVTNSITNFTDVEDRVVPTPISLTPLLYYTFESATSNVVTNFGSLSTSHNLTITSGSISTTTVNKGTGSLNVSGSGSYARVNSSITIQSGTNFSMSFWVYVSSTSFTSSSGFIMHAINFTDGGVPRYYIVYDVGAQTARFGISTTETPARSMTHSAWHYIGWSVSGNTWITQIDGSQQTHTYSLTAPLTVSHFGFGCEFGSSTTVNKYIGSFIDNFRFFNGSLTANELNTLYNEGVPQPATLGFLNFNSNRLLRYAPSTNTVKAYGSGVNGTTALTETYSNSTDIYTSGNVFAVSQTTPSQYTVVEAITNANNKTTISKPANANLFFGPSGKGLYALEVPNNPVLSPTIIPPGVSRTINYYVSNPDLAAFRWASYALSTSSTSLVQVGRTYSTYDNLSSTYTFIDVSFASVGTRTLYIRNIDPDLSFNVLQFDLSVATITPVTPSTLTITQLTSTTIRITVTTPSSPPESYFAAGIGYYYYRYTTGVDFSNVDASYSNLIGMITDETYPAIQSDVSGLVAGTPYTFYVRARSTTGGGNSTSISQSITLASSVPLRPNSVTVDQSGANVLARVTDASNSTSNGVSYWYYAYNTADASNNNGNISSYTQGPNFTSSPTTISIPGLLTGSTYIIYVVARNGLGDSSSVASPQITTLSAPLAPVIDTANTKSTTTGTIRVFFTDASNLSNNGIGYWYSTNGSTYINSNVLFDGRVGSYQFDISGLTEQTTPYTISVRAQNTAGNSPEVSTSPLPVFGNLPVISSVSPVLGFPMYLRVVFNQTPFKGTSPVTYYYSRNADGSDRVLATDGSFVVMDASQTTTIYVVADNSAGNLVSLGVSGTPYLLGSQPTIDSVIPTPNVGNSVTVSFTQSTLGIGNPVYYYGFDGSSVRLDASATASPLVIRNLNGQSPYSIYLVARNEAGDVSSNVYPNINVFGAKPSITGITRNIGNSVTVAFTQIPKGTDPTTYYGSTDGSNIIVDASSSGTSLIISNLTDVSAYNISIIAVNPVGNVVSDTSSGIHILGTKPTITGITQNVGNSVTVTFEQSQKGTGTTIYYGSTDGSSVILDASSTGTSLTISNLTDASAYSIYVIARNPAGDVPSDPSLGINIFGVKPTITGITKNIGNSVTVAFTQIPKGTDPTIYYGSIDGSTAILDASSSDTSLTIRNLTDASAYDITIIARNPAGDVLSDVSSGVTILGTTPTLTASPVENADKVVRLTYAQTNSGTAPVAYFYTIDNSANTTNRTPFPVDSSTVDVSNVLATTTYYVIAQNSAGNVISLGVSGTPYLLGSIPTFTPAPVLNSPGVVRLSYSQTTTGTTPVTYFYTTTNDANTTTRTQLTANPFDVSNVTGTTTFYVVASNLAGNVISDGSSATPYLLGSQPTIDSVIPSIGNSVTVSFTQSTVGIGNPVYYYGFDGSSVRLDASATASPLVIQNLNGQSPYSIYLVARNEAGDISSNSFSPVNVLGTKPSITGITRNIGNSVTVTFEQSQKGTDTTVYYGSTDGSNIIADASSSGTSLTISSLTDLTPYNISIIARNPAGDVVSDPSSGIHILGTKPTITGITRNVGNSVTVTFEQSQKGTGTTVYYGSINGSSVLLDASSSGTSLTISNLTDASAYSIYVIAINPAGSVVSDPSLNVSILGTQPSFTLIPQTNNLRGTITQTNRGTLPVSYYYSTNGVDKEFEMSFPTFDISGTVSRTFSIIADNSAGQVASSPVTGTPFIFGTVPSISSIVPGSEKLTVNFSQDQTGTTPVRYFYSYEPSGAVRIAQVNPPSFDIIGTQSRTVYIVADNSAGTLISAGVSATPFTFGSKPVITLIQRGSQKITVTFTQASKGTEPVKYYYSFNRSSRIAEVTTNTFDILYEVDSRIGNITYNVAVSGGLYSFTGEVTGTNPSITVVKGSVLTFNVNSPGHPFWIKTANITGTDYAVTTDISNNGTQSGAIVWNTSNIATGTYYYICEYHSYMVGSITVIPPENNPLTTTKNVSIIADNSAGTLISDDVSGTPYTFGSVPVIQSVTPGPNKLTVLFSQDTSGNTPSSYSYSFDASGTNPTVINSSGTFIVNGSEPRTIYVIATNLAGSLISLGVSGTPFVVGDTPSINNVIPGPYSLTVQFSQQNAGNTPVTYYYSYAEDGSNPQGPVFLPEFTVTASTTTTIYVVADSSSGYLVSAGFTRTPFILGDNPVIDDPIIPGAETLTVSFTQSPKGTEPVTYYYSFLSDGSGRIGPVTSPFTISTTTTRTVYVVASNPAGNLVSAGKTATPYTFANKPVITDIVPSAYNLKVYFTPSTSGTTPITYYYSESSNGANRVGPVTSPFDISGSVERTIYIVADNSAGNVVSTGFTRAPYIFGSVPVIDSIVPGPNRMTVTFTSSVGGTEPVYHYYSYDPSGSNGILTTSPFVITGTSTRTVYIVANNPVGNLVSVGVSGTPFVVGGTPIIESVESQTNNLRVTFSHPEPGNTAVTYYYSDDASGNNLIRQVYLPTFDISGTVTTTIYVVSINSAGKLISEPVTATPFTFGTVPVIESVTPGTERLSVKFRQDQTGTTPVTYYYSFLADGSNAIGPVDTSFSFTETLPRTIYIVARNAAGNLVSSGISGTPFLFGSKPVITGLQPGLNRLTVSFTQATTGTTPVRYFYSEFANGSNRVGPVTSPFDISNISTLKTVYIIADNSAGVVISDASSGTPYTLGTNPVVSAIVPGTNKLTVSFSQVSKGTEPVTYYYSDLSNGSNRIGPVTSPFDISTNVARIVYIIAENLGGTLISLSEASGTPYIFGSTPSIVSVQPGTNSLIVSFNPSVGGTTPITHYYSYDSSGVPRVAQIQSGASVFTISDISSARTVYIVAENPAGNLVSAGVSGTPYIFGEKPVISSVIPGTNKLIVSFSQTNKGTLPVTYYYSFDGSGRLGVVTTPSFEFSTFEPRMVYVIADNSAGSIVSTGVPGTPYTFGSALSISLSAHVSNTIRVSYSQAVQGTTPTTYRYVLNGGSSVTVGTSPTGTFDISGLTSTSLYSFYMVATNDAGDLSSNTVSQAVLGTTPTLSIVPQPNNLRVNFAQSNTGTLPIKYFYSFDGVARLGQVNTPAFDISGTVQRTVYIIADNSAGTIVSAGVTGTPYTFGSALSISLSAPVSNTIRVSYSQVTQGTLPTTYRYVLNGGSPVTVGTSPTGIFDISGLTSTSLYSFYMVATNDAGDLSSNTVSQAVLGTTPTLSIVPQPNNLRVNFAQSNTGTLPVRYFYSFDGVARLGQVNTPAFDISSTVQRTVYIIADNSAGTIVSAGVTGTPYVVGVPPTVNIQSGVNKLTVYFSSTNGTAPVTYYYSDASNGANRIGPVTSPFDISGTVERTIYIVADNSAGTIISSAATGRPYIIGSAPVINAIVPGINSIVVDFSGSTGGYPAPYAYYYSLDGADYTLANSVTSPITIAGLTVEKEYTVTLIAQNSAGLSLPSNMMSGSPIYQQPIFNWVMSSPPKEPNSDSGGSFAQDRKVFVNIAVPAATTLEEQQVQLQKQYIGGGRRSGSDVVNRRRAEAIGSSLNAAGANFSYTETRVLRRNRFRR